MRNSKQFPKILITSSGEKVPLIHAAKNAVKRIDKNGIIVAGDTRREVPTKSIADDFWMMPPTSAINTEKIIDGCKKMNLTGILPTRDGELLFWSSIKNRLHKEGIEVISSEKEPILTCLDKYRFYKYGKLNDIPVIETAINPNDINARKFVVKEKYGSRSYNIKTNLYLNDAIEYAKKLDSPIFQPFIQGTEISIDSWFDSKEKLVGFVTRTRDKVEKGEAVKTTTFINHPLDQKLKNILSKFKLQGPVNFQAFIEEDDKLSIIECNPRIGGASLVSIEVGLDFLYWSFQDSWSKNSSLKKFQRSKSNVCQTKVVDTFKYEPV